MPYHEINRKGPTGVINRITHIFVNLAQVFSCDLVHKIQINISF
jgi:hypothetical protein